MSAEVAASHRSVDDLLGLDAEALTGVEAVSVLTDAHRAIARLEALRLRALTVVERTEIWSVDGSVSFAAWLRRELGVDHRAAQAEVKLSRAAAQLPTMVADLASGATSRAHVETVARIGLANQDRAAVLPAVEPVFAQVARSQPPGVLARVARAWADQVDPMATVCDELQAHRRRFVHLSQLGDGWRLDGFFGHEQGATLAVALNAAVTLVRRRDNQADVDESGNDSFPDGCACPPEGQPSPVWSTPDAAALASSRQRADALIDLVKLAMASGGLPENGGARPTVVVTVPLVRLEQARSAEASSGQHGSRRPRVRPADAAGATANCAGIDETLPFLDGVGQISVTTGVGDALISDVAAQRISCDAEVQRIVLGPEGLPLDVGRSTRTVPLHLRRALNARDRGCVFPGCDRPPGWTEAHHLTHWAQGGATALHNTLLLCARHHHDIHTYGHAIKIGDAGRPKITLPPKITLRPGGARGS